MLQALLKAHHVGAALRRVPARNLLCDSLATDCRIVTCLSIPLLVSCCIFLQWTETMSPVGTYTYMSPKRVGNKVCISVLRHASASLLTLGAWECHQGGAGARRQYRNCAADVQL